MIKNRLATFLGILGWFLILSQGVWAQEQPRQIDWSPLQRLADDWSRPQEYVQQQRIQPQQVPQNRNVAVENHYYAPAPKCHTELKFYPNGGSELISKCD